MSITGVRFTAAAYTYMEPHGVPSGGDWALDRMGAGFLQGTQNVRGEQPQHARAARFWVLQFLMLQTQHSF